MENLYSMIYFLWRR